MPSTEVIIGRVLYCDDTAIYVESGREILCSYDQGRSWKTWMALPRRVLGYISGRSQVFSRLLRLGVHSLTVSDAGALILADRSSYFVFREGFGFISAVRGSRPLVICEKKGNFYYGEYRSNPERSAVHVWQWKPGQSDWGPVWRFQGIRHVHGVFNDVYTGSMWVTTGDEDSEAGIWCTVDGFKTLHRVIGGGQQSRAVQLLFTRDHVYFGSDTPKEKNYIYRMNRQGRNVERLVAVGGSVFYGCKVGGSLFFSTAVEPSDVNQRRAAEVWRSDDGCNWYQFLEFSKDSWSMKYLQYGQVLFPAGPGDGKHVYCSPFAARGHGTTIRINVEESKGQSLIGRFM